MKKFKKLIPAFCMLLVSAILLGSSTYAWFSMNKTVTATGMQVTAKSNSSYLLIDAVDNAENKGTSALSKAAAFVSGGTNVANKGSCTEEHEHNETNCGDKWVAANTDKMVYPTYYATGTTMPGTADGATSLTVTEGHWYTANNRNSNHASNAITNVRDLGADAPVNYVCTYKSWLTLSADSEDYSGKITVKSTLASGDAGTSIVVVLSDGTHTETLKLTNGTESKTTNDFTITKSTSVAVTYYVYIDGTTTNVNSDYINGPQQLTGTISVEFTIQ